MAHRVPSRWDDRLLLVMLKWRARGRTSTDLAARLGVPTDHVKTATNRVRAADLNESKEPEAKDSYRFVERGRKK